jgi:hypothetical protein
MKTGELSPLLAEGKPVDWWFAFKFNAATFPGDEFRESNPGTPLLASGLKLSGGTIVDL